MKGDWTSPDGWKRRPPKGSYRTVQGYNRSTGVTRERFVTFLQLQTRRQRTTIPRWQCYCGSHDVVEWLLRAYCPTCGRILHVVTATGYTYPTVDDLMLKFGNQAQVACVLRTRAMIKELEDAR